jgi:SOS response associated peptidase (SRAP)
VPLDSFYEWKKTATGKQPYAIALADRRLIGMAGLRVQISELPTGDFGSNRQAVSVETDRPFRVRRRRIKVVENPLHPSGGRGRVRWAPRAPESPTSPRPSPPPRGT